MPRVSEEEQREVREVRQKVANGDVYVYEVTYERDPETNRRVQVSKRTLGKIPAGSTELIPTRGRTTAKAAVRTEPKAAARSSSKPVPKAAPAIPADSPDHPFARVGLRKVLEWIGKASKIDRDLKECIDGDEAVALYGMARYWFATNGAPLTKIGAWQETRRMRLLLPLNPEPSEERRRAAAQDFFASLPLDFYGEVFRWVKERPKFLARFFEHRTLRLRKAGVERTWAFDVTVFDEEFADPLRMRREVHRALGMDRLKVRKLLVLTFGEDFTPAAFAEPSVYAPTGEAVRASLAKLQPYASPAAPVVVSGPESGDRADARSATEAKLADFAAEGTPFVLAMDDSGLEEPWLCKAVDEQKKALRSHELRLGPDGDVACATISREFAFEVRKPGSAGSETVKRELFVHIFRDWNLYRAENDRLADTVWDLKKAVEAGETHFNPGAQALIDRHFSIRPRRADEYDHRFDEPKPGPLVAEFISEAQHKAQAKMGLFVLVSNVIEDPQEALRAYRKWEEVQDHFARCRDGFERRRTDVLTGRRFAQFLALCYKAFFEKAAADARERVWEGAEAERETEAAETLWKWLREHDAVRMLDELGAVDARLDQGLDDGRMPWIRARDVRFLKLIGFRDVGE